MLPSLIKAKLASAVSSIKEAPYAIYKGSNFDTNENPVIGILSQPLPDELKKDPRLKDKTSYIMAAYVDFMKSAGARVVTIIWGEDESVTDDLLTKVNGVLFPGGSGDYLELGDHIYKKAIEMNDAGDFFPLWGTCLGHENLARFASSSGDPLSSLVSDGNSLTLDFLVYAPVQNTKMFATF